jgi:2,3-bisphosphoglycerate-independent phosphoglycerate mutase
VVKGLNLCGNISGTDPLKDHKRLQVVQALDDSESAKHTASIVNELSCEMRRILRSHPLNQERLSQGKSAANVVLLRGCGIRIQVSKFCCSVLDHDYWHG